MNPRPKAYESSALPLSYSGNRDIVPDLFRSVKLIFPFVYNGLVMFPRPEYRPSFADIKGRTQAASYQGMWFLATG